MDSIGYIGGTLLGVQLIPQIWKTYCCKSAKEISYIFLCLNLSGLLCMSAYGVYDNNQPLYVPTFTSFVLTSVLLMQKVYYQGLSEAAEDIKL